MLKPAIQWNNLRLWRLLPMCQTNQRCSHGNDASRENLLKQINNKTLLHTNVNLNKSLPRLPAPPNWGVGSTWALAHSITINYLEPLGAPWRRLLCSSCARLFLGSSPPFLSCSSSHGVLLCGVALHGTCSAPCMFFRGFCSVAGRFASYTNIF